LVPCVKHGSVVVVEQGSRLPGLHFIMEEICLLGYGKIQPARVMLLPIAARMGKEPSVEKKSQ